ncbi:tRNA dimethylallyltransferase [Neocloeon triangulifer]|uniref:tRNA dimethylallyltransferase n=1 Tax=Neocloeon triangulifer TaxID=2078957 RepID=UPI00286F8CAD|nr:tRNA dimethylallyltransferase [Neocloeon triangulifer]
MAGMEVNDEMWSRVPLVVILGATGTGKSKLAIELAKKFGGEVVGADSMQVYKRLDIVTNKVTPEEMAQVPHHMIDILSPKDNFNVVDYRNQALAKIAEIDSRSKLPIVVGGTNYYIESLLWKVLVQYECKIIKAPEAANSVAADQSASLEFAKLDNDELMKRLEAVDPETALRLHPNDRRKVIRALEVFKQEGRPLSAVLREQKSADGSSPIGGPLRFPRSIIFWLQWDQGILDEDLDKRVDEMLEKGLLNELLQFHSEYNAERLATSETEPDYTKGIFQSIGFKEFHPYLVMDESERQTEESKKLLQKCICDMKMATRRYARRQVKWVNSRFLSSIHRMTPKFVPLTLKSASNWEAEILEPAAVSVQKLLDGEIVIATPSEQLPDKQLKERKETEPCREFCESCQRLFVIKSQWEDHMKSKKHKRRVDSLNKQSVKKRKLCSETESDDLQK